MSSLRLETLELLLQRLQRWWLRLRLGICGGGNSMMMVQYADSCNELACQIYRSTLEPSSDLPELLVEPETPRPPLPGVCRLVALRLLLAKSLLESIAVQRAISHL